MIPKSFQKIIGMILLIAVLTPCVVQAQNNVQTNPPQTFSNEELAQMLSPVALYPDPLLSQILMAATYPLEVVEAERWLTKNPYVTGTALDEALKAKDWDVSILSLCHYPKILTMMSNNLSWTARLGDAFVNQEQDVMDTVQELRARARAAGNLSTTNEQTVIVEDRFIRIEPVSPDYIYVPAYDPYVIYGHWWLPMYPPLPIIFPGLVITGSGIIFAPRFYVGSGVFGWNRFNWREHNIVIVDIDRTKRFNRDIHVYKEADRRPWRPDRDRRFVRDRRAAEIPKFHPPVRPSQNGQRPDRSPGGPVMTPDKPHVIDRDKRPAQPRMGDGDRRPGLGVMTPGMINKEKLRQPEAGTIDKKQPVIRDRSNVEGSEARKHPPLIDQKGVMSTDKAREHDSRTDQHNELREDREDRPQRTIDRGDRGGRTERPDRPERGGMHR